MRAFFTLIVALLLGGATAGTAVALPQAAAAVAPADPSAAYYFILGRHLEDERKVDEAIAAHKKAIALAPDSAEVRAELAALYARQDRARKHSKRRNLRSSAIPTIAKPTGSSAPYTRP
jgi:tetratricopeptide (TPR) repeat protein